jgi:gamma-glutamylcyclotransferase (GGCT)/AIG2-like uncharacterized protein YtfP
MHYFAYGSMMHFDEVRQRCPSARFVAVAKLPDHALKFTRRSVRRGCGVADAVGEQGQEVWGVVYSIADAELDRLDEGEGFNPSRPLSADSYVREQRDVYRDGHSDQPIHAWIYFANRQPTPPRPSPAYKKLLVDGAKQWGLPPEYQALLERIDTADHGHNT